MITERTLSKKVADISKSFPVLLVTGPRQVGKTTLLKHCAENNRNYVTLDDFDACNLAKNDPMLFLKTYPAPVIIDEVQYAPELLRAIKIVVDEQQEPGMYWLTGSQKFDLMQGITETLAGRIAIIDMLGLSYSEIRNRSDSSIPFIPTEDWIQHLHNINPNKRELMDIYNIIWRGSYPKPSLDQVINKDDFYSSYISTYINRDVQALSNVGDLASFHLFLRAAAARTGQLINYHDLSSDADISIPTAKKWLSILESSGLVYLLHPYHNNVTNRLIKTPKLYFLDTGLCTYLTKWSSPSTLEAGAMSGAILESYIFSEILKSYWHNGKHPYLYFYRDKDGKEVDLLIEENNTLYPVEFKKTATPSKTASKHFHNLQKLDKPIGHGAVICFIDKPTPLSSDVTAIPTNWI